MKSSLQSTLSRVVLAVLVSFIAIAVVGVAILSVLSSRVEQRVRDAASAQGLRITWDDFGLRPWGEVSMDNVAVRRDGVTIATFDELEVDVRLFSRRLFSEKPVIEGIAAERGTIAPSVALFGQYAAQARSAAGTSTSTTAADDGGLRELFGGRPPHLSFEDIKVETAHLGGPARNITIDQFETELDGRSWTGKGRLTMEGHSDDFVLPEHATLESTFVETDERWQPGPLRVRFDEPLVVRKGGQELTTRGVDVDGDGRVSLREVAVTPGLFGASIEADAIQVSPISAIVHRDLDEIEELRIESPRVEVSGEIIQAAMQSLPASAEQSSGGSSKARSWNALLDQAWGKAFGLSQRGLELLDQRLPPTVIVDDATVVVSVPDSDQKVSLSAMHFLFMGGDRNPRVSLRTEASVGEKPLGRFSFLTSGGESPKIIVRAEQVDAKILQSQLSDLGVWPETMTMSGAFDIELEATEDPTGMHPFAGGVVLRDLAILEPRIALERIEIPQASYQFEGRHAPEARVADPSIISHRIGYASIPAAQQIGAIQIDRGIARVGDVSAELTFEVYGLAALPEHLPARVDVQLDLPPTDVRALWEAIPAAVRGPLTDAKLRGEVSWALDMELPLRNASASRWRSAPVLEDFRVVDLPHEVDVRRMLRSMEVTLTDPKLEFEKQIEIPAMRSQNDPRGRTARPPWKAIDYDEGADCGDYVYVPLDYISPHLRNGVLTTEDGSFFSHEGFNTDAIRSAMERNLEEGKFVRGASTISMQLVKNLFLTGRKTLSRKAQEAFLVWLMESVVRVPKSRILEIYFNVIEYGPRVFGIHHASLYYFGKRPDGLTVNEVAWFISTLPGPKLYHRYFDRGSISDYWWDHMQGYIDAMYRRGRLDEYELLTAKAERPRFRDADAACAPGPVLNNPDRFASEVEELRRAMHHLRVVQDRERSAVLRYAELYQQRPAPYAVPQE